MDQSRNVVPDCKLGSPLNGPDCDDACPQFVWISPTFNREQRIAAQLCPCTETLPASKEPAHFDFEHTVRCRSAHHARVNSAAPGLCDAEMFPFSPDSVDADILEVCTN